MKFADLKAGETYQFATSNSWAADTREKDEYDSFPVTIPDPAMRFNVGGYDPSAWVSGSSARRTYPAPDGRYVTGVRGDGSTVHVMARYLRTTREDYVQRVAWNKQRRAEELALQKSQTAAAFDAAQALRERVEAAGLTGITIQSTDAYSGYGRSRFAEVTTRITPEGLASLLDRLERAEQLARDAGFGSELRA